MKPFDGNEYRKRVMARLLEDYTLADPHTGDPFLVCDVDAAADAAAVRNRVDAVVAFWQKDRNHPKYKGLAGQLVVRREEYLHVLTDPAERAKAETRVHGARAQTDANAVDQLEKLAATLLKRFKGIPRSRVQALSSIGKAEGLSEAGFAAWLNRHTVVDDADPDSAAPWEGAVRRQVRSTLDELARSDSSLAPRCRTLFTFLGVNPNARPAEISAAHARLAGGNRSRTRDRTMTLTEDLLTQVSTRLLPPGGVESYVASLRADARDSLKNDLRRMAVLTGSLPASEMEALSARLVGLGWGFAAADARDLVRAAANEVHLAVEVGGEIDLVVCPSCDRPQSVGRRKTCQYCRAHLFLDCPACHTMIAAASDVCPACNAPLAAWRAAAQAVPAAQTALDDGRVAEAARICAEVLVTIDPTAAPAPLRAVAAAAADLTERARGTWAEAHQYLAHGALWSAAASATWLMRNARDVPDPTPDPSGAQSYTAAGPGAVSGGAASSVRADGSLPREASALAAFIGERQRAGVAATEAVLKVGGQEAEQALTAVLRDYPDCPQALAALAALPLPGPQQLDVTLSVGTAIVSWVPAHGAGRNVRYRVDRNVLWPSSHTDHTTVGTTTATHLADAGAPAGTRVSYTVSAVAGTRSSAPVTTAGAVFVERDIEVLAAEVVNGDVVLTWPRVGVGAAEAMVEREVDPSSGLTVPIRRIRPAQSGVHVDDDVSFDVPYTYRVFLNYRTPDGDPVRTSGQSVKVLLRHPPRAIRDLWARTDEAGQTTVAFSSPPSGLVRLYATSDSDSRPLGEFTAGTLDDLNRAAARGSARLVGEGRRRVVDSVAWGWVMYQAVTVVDDVAAAGAVLAHTAIAKPTGLQVVDDTGSTVRVNFELPAGVTEAFVCWRRDKYPATATEPFSAKDGAGSLKRTNTKLQIDGGVTIPAAVDGRALYVAVFPAVRPGPTASVVPTTVAATLEARQAAPVEVGYRVRFSGVFNKRLEVTAECLTSGVELPPFVVLAQTPAQFAGHTLESHPGGGRQVTFRVDDERWPAGSFQVRIQARAAPGAVVSVIDPPEHERSLDR